MKFPKLQFLQKRYFQLLVATFALILTIAIGNLAVAQIPIQTRDNGAPVGNNQQSQTAGDSGPVLLQDTTLIEKLARFDRERIPERVVHARGTGVHGEFVSTANLSDMTMAAPFQEKGKKTPVFVRFSTVIHSKGSPETLRDPRGFATKFYTEEGNWDLVGNNLPVFFIRDAIKFPDMVHSLKPSPITNRQDPNRFFDFFSHMPESTNMLTLLYSDLGTPASYREMDGNSVHAYKFVNKDGQYKYIKFNWQTQQGEHNLSAEEAQEIQSKEFNSHSKDLYEHINQGNFPKWDLLIQVLNPEDLNKFEFNPLDATKIWPEDLVPKQKVGTMTLNRLPDNFFEETEQSAFAPSNTIPGIEASEDRLLQGRLFSYADTHRHRLGVNHTRIPVNQPLGVIHNGNQEGFASAGNTKSDVNYEPSRRARYQEDSNYVYSQLPITGNTQQVPIEKTLNFKQAGERYRSFSEEMRKHLISNLAGDLGQVEDQIIRTELAAFFYKADQDYGTKVAQAVDVDLNQVKQLADELQE